MSRKTTRTAPRPPAPARPTPESDARENELAPGRKLLFTVGMLLLPVVFFVLLELGLRAGGYGADYPLFVDAPGAPGRLMPSREVATRYFAAEASIPTPNPDYFLRDKPEGTIRVVAQGGSSTAGFPFYRGAAFPQVLGARLRMAYPDREVEVVNTAMAAVNSYTLLDLADEILEIEPDVVVVYAGHNEFYGALGAASTESFGRSPGVVRAYLRLRGLRTVQLIRNAAAGLARSFAPERPAGAPPTNTLMARMIGEQSVPLGGDIYQAGARQFASNLDRLLEAYADAGVPVYVSTLASNEGDQRPFVTDLAGPDTAAVGRAIRQGRSLLAAGDTAAAAAPFGQALALDSLAADAWYGLATAERAAGDLDAARAAFVRARDLDALRFRAPSAFNAVIRETAARHGAVVVEGEAALRSASSDAIIGHEMMLEHLHPTLDGYAALADAFYDAITADALFGEARPTPPGRVVRRVTPMDSLAGRVRVSQLTQSWPYRPGEEQPVALGAEPREVVALTQRVMNGANWVAGADTLAQIYARLDRPRDVRTTYEAITQSYPFLSEPWSALASYELTRAQAGAPDASAERATGWYAEALRRNPSDFQALAMLGAIRLQAGDRADAVAFLERAREIAPKAPRVLYNLSGAYLLDGRAADAVPLLEQLLQLDPGNPTYQALYTQAQAGAR